MIKIPSTIPPDIFLRRLKALCELSDTCRFLARAGRLSPRGAMRPFLPTPAHSLQDEKKSP